MTTHIAYDVYFDKLCDLLINGDKFDADTWKIMISRNALLKLSYT
jgi:hypothetical protein